MAEFGDDGSSHRLAKKQLQQATSRAEERKESIDKAMAFLGETGQLGAREKMLLNDAPFVKEND